MDLYYATENWTGIPGQIAPADGNYTPQVLTPIASCADAGYASHLVAPASLPADLHGTSANQNRQQDALRDSGQAGANRTGNIGGRTSLELGPG
jgi:hypothetical protein